MIILDPSPAWRAATLSRARERRAVPRTFSVSGSGLVVLSTMYESPFRRKTGAFEGITVRDDARARRARRMTVTRRGVLREARPVCDTHTHCGMQS